MEDEKKRIFFTNLLLLEFDPVAMTQKHRIEFNRDMFDKPNKLGLYEVIHFLLKKLDSQRWNNEFKNLLQVKEKKIEAEFKKMASIWLTDLAKTDPTSNLPYLINIFSKPYGSKLYSFLINLTSYIIRHDLQTTFKKSAYQDYVWPSSDTESSYNLLKTACNSVSYHHINRMKQFTDMHADWMRIAGGLAEKYRRNIKEEKRLEEELRQFEELAITEKESEDKKNIIGERLNKIRKSLENLKKLERVMRINNNNNNPNNITRNTLYDDENTVNNTNFSSSAFQKSKENNRSNVICNKNNINNETDGEACWWRKQMVVVDGSKLSCDFPQSDFAGSEVHTHDHKVHLINFLKQCNKSLETIGKLMQNGTDHSSIEDTLQQINCRLKHNIKLSAMCCDNKRDTQIPHLKSSIDALSNNVQWGCYKSMDLPLLNSTTYQAPQPTASNKDDNANNSTKHDNASNNSNKDVLCIYDFFSFESLMTSEYAKKRGEKIMIESKKHLESATATKQSISHNDEDIRKCMNSVFNKKHDDFENGHQVNDENKSCSITFTTTTTTTNDINNGSVTTTNNNHSTNNDIYRNNLSATKSNVTIFNKDDYDLDLACQNNCDINNNRDNNSNDDDIVTKNDEDEDFNMLRFGREVAMMKNSFELHKMNNINEYRANYTNLETYSNNITNHNNLSGITHNKDNNDIEQVSISSINKNINASGEIFNGATNDNVGDDWLECDVVNFINDDGADVLLMEDEDNDKESRINNVDDDNINSNFPCKNAVQISSSYESNNLLYISHSSFTNRTATEIPVDATIHTEASNSFKTTTPAADVSLIDFNTPKINNTNYKRNSIINKNYDLGIDLDTEKFETVLPTDFEEFNSNNAIASKNNDVSNARRLSKLRINSDLNFFIENHFSTNKKDVDIKDDVNNDDGEVFKEGIADVSLLDLKDFDELNLL